MKDNKEVNQKPTTVSITKGVIAAIFAEVILSE